MSMPVTRRDVLVATGAVSAAWMTGSPSIAAPAARYRRYEANSVQGSAMLASYRKAVAAMLALPETDPRNWYRNAFVHALDCPHANWWFLPWHRGYVGWFERTCRELSGDPNFALPYWDWTASQQLPSPMFDGALSPEDASYISDFAELRRRFDPALRKTDFWTRSTDTGDADGTTRFGQLLNRGVRNLEDFWFDAHDDPRGALFFEKGRARRQTKANPQLGPRPVASTASNIIAQALAPVDFVTFASPSARSHAAMTGFGLLENEPHNKVHNDIGGVTFVSDGNGSWTQSGDSGGFMQGFFSPIDPVFYLHHANIDRLWDVWTRKQQAGGGEVVPQGKPGSRWSEEPFLFFVNELGRPVTKVAAGDYASIGDFAYDYAPGSGEQTITRARMRADATRSDAEVLAQAVGRSGDDEIVVKLAVGGPKLASLATRSLFAKVTVELAHRHAESLPTIFIRVGGRSAPALSLALFGNHMAHGPLTWTVPLSDALRTAGLSLAAAAQGEITFFLKEPGASAQAGMGHAAGAHHGDSARITAVMVEAH